MPSAISKQKCKIDSPWGKLPLKLEWQGFMKNASIKDHQPILQVWNIVVAIPHKPIILGWVKWVVLLKFPRVIDILPEEDQDR